jgi:secondary thiamine-phosphate synthase enzyme
VVHTDQLDIQTQGNAHVLDIHEQVVDVVSRSEIEHGIVTVFVVGSTAAITTTEAEPGLLNTDLKTFFERIAPEHDTYLHEQTWNDDNGHSHVRASALGPSITIPILHGRMTCGTWQQIILIDFDTRPRRRKVIVQVMGERA